MSSDKKTLHITQLYRSREEIAIKIERDLLFRKLSTYFYNYRHKELTIEQLRQINAITKATE